MGNGRWMGDGQSCTCPSVPLAASCCARLYVGDLGLLGRWIRHIQTVVKVCIAAVRIRIRVSLGQLGHT
jgi:hypothetical protein